MNPHPAELREKFVRLPLHSGLVEQLAAAIQAPGFVARQQVEAGLLDEADEMPAIEVSTACCSTLHAACSDARTYAQPAVGLRATGQADGCSRRARTVLQPAHAAAAQLPIPAHPARQRCGSCLCSVLAALAVHSSEPARSSAISPCTSFPAAPPPQDLVYQGEALLPVLRLLLLYCAVHGGIPKRYYESLR